MKYYLIGFLNVFAFCLSLTILISIWQFDIPEGYKICVAILSGLTVLFSLLYVGSLLGKGEKQNGN